MKQTINLNQFRNAFELFKRYEFSYEGLEVLFNSLENMEQDMGQEIELDVIGFCCEYVELTLGELLSEYPVISDETLTDDNETELLGLATDYLNDNTWLLGLSSINTFVFQQF